MCLVDRRVHRRQRKCLVALKFQRGRKRRVRRLTWSEVSQIAALLVIRTANGIGGGAHTGWHIRESFVEEDDHEWELQESIQVPLSERKVILMGEMA